MLKLPGGTMQTEEVVPRAQSIGIDGGLTDGVGLQQHHPPQHHPRHHHQHHNQHQHQHQHHLQHHSAHLRYPLPPLIHMAVKQEPQEEEEERSRDANALR